MSDRYPEREVMLRGVYCHAQVLTRWEGMKPPRYIVVNSLDERRPGEWVCEQRMGAWMDADLSRVAYEASANYAGDADYLSRFPAEARPYCDRAYQDGYDDGVSSEGVQQHDIGQLLADAYAQGAKDWDAAAGTFPGSSWADGRTKYVDGILSGLASEAHE